ncbi:MAG: carboxymuconolactone decarboxylase family protein [Litoreibacter sp.]
MPNFPSHDLETAPEASKPLLEISQKAYGRLPGLHKVMSESPAVLEGYQAIANYAMKTSLDADEITVVWQTINVENECHYCVPAHTGLAKMMKVDDSISEALRNETPLASAKLEALRKFTLQVVRQRGFVEEAQFEAFFAAGYEHRTALEIILVLAQKTMTNYINHFAKTAVDEPMQAFLWERGENRIES